MKSTIENRVNQLLDNDFQLLLKGRKVGLEKESLRVAVNGQIAQTRHPEKFGSALTNPYITTDYSEALLELVTPPFECFDETLRFLDDTHRFVYQNLEDEILWSTSMPCVVDGSASIPIAEYGVSNIAKMKTTYRRGLGHRYGRMMQVIAGIHYNYSFSPTFWAAYQTLLGNQQNQQTFVSASYMGMVRNLLRYGWLVPYLFGASPAICGSFLEALPHSLEPLFRHTYYSPYATSLRVSDIGYKNSKEGEAGICINYNSLESYIKSLRHAISTPYPHYQSVGLCANGEWQQLNSNLLQIENEYYSSVRPKQLLQSMEKPTSALAQRGIAYIELRSLDVNVYEPLGINQEQMLFLESFFLFSLLQPSESYSKYELTEIQYNINQVAERGRDPQLRLRKAGQSIPLRDWARAILAQMASCCELLDDNNINPAYCRVLQQQREKIEEPDLTPSARILTEMIENKEEFFEFSLRCSEQHQQWFSERKLDAGKQADFETTARLSIQQQREIEQADDQPFEQFLQRYLQ